MSFEAFINEFYRKHPAWAEKEILEPKKPISVRVEMPVDVRAKASGEEAWDGFEE